jgi:hypothetical protein
MPVVVALRQKTPSPDKSPVETPGSDVIDAPSSRIRCPLCLWQPAPSSRWYCTDCAHPEYFHGGCGMAWNTFDTRGRCPGCDHRWRWTACLSCAEWSLHEDWYVKEKGKLD